MLQNTQEICYPPNTRCQRNLQVPPRVFCCPNSFSYSHSADSAVCPPRAFICPSSLGGGCCPIGLRCAQSLCLEYEYKTLAVLTSLMVPKETRLAQQPRAGPLVGTIQSLFTAPTLPSHTVGPPGKPLSRAAAPTCTAPIRDLRPGAPSKRVQDIPINERTWGTPTAWSAKLGEVAMKSSGRGEHVEQVTNWTRILWLMAMLGIFAGVMLVL